MYTERVTGLESYGVCPLKYHMDKFDGGNPKTIVNTSIGDIIHIAHQYPDMAMILSENFFEDVYPKIMGEKNNILKTQVDNMIGLAEGWIEEFKDKQKFFEIKNRIIIKGVLVTGSYDCLIVNEDGSLHLFDYKTTGNASFYNNRIEKHQIMMYALYTMNKFGVNKIKVSYELYVKSKTTSNVKRKRKSKILYKGPMVLKDDTKYIDNIEEKVNKLVESWRLSKETGIYWAKPINEDGTRCSHCYFCPMRDIENAAKAGLPVCPMKVDRSEINNSKEVDFAI